MERWAWVTGFFLINLARGERIGARIFTHQLSTSPPLLPTFLPPPSPVTQSQRGRGGRVRQHVESLTHGLEEGRGGEASQPGHLDER